MAGYERIEGVGDDFDVDDYLTTWKHESFEDAQHAMGLAGNGLLDIPTLNAFKAPRCGVETALVSAMGAGDAWQKQSLRWSLNSATPDLPVTAVLNTFRQAFALWAEVTPLSFSEAVPADIEIEFVRGNHGDGLAFDGRGGVLAHAFFPPPNPRAGDMHFDEAEQWSTTVPTPSGQQDLFTVALHEIGHALGLTHSNDPGAIMYPTVGRVQRSLGLDDIRRIRRLYPGGPAPAPPGPVDPWDDPTIVAWINEWVSAANRCFRRVEPGARIDQFGRWCGRRKNGTISHCNQRPDPKHWSSQRYLWHHNLKIQAYPLRVREYVAARQQGRSAAELAGCG